MARLDFCLVTPDIQSNISNVGMYHGYKTDHSFIYLYLENINITCGSSYYYEEEGEKPTKFLCN